MDNMDNQKIYQQVVFYFDYFFKQRGEKVD